MCQFLIDTKKRHIRLPLPVCDRLIWRFVSDCVELLLFVACCDVSESFHPVSARHACYAYNYERDAEHLSHVEGKRLLECFLHFLGIFDEESCREDVGEAESEEESCAHTLRLFAVDSPSDEEE